MNIDTRLRRVESALNTLAEKDYNTVVFVDECPVFDSCIVTVNGKSHQGTMEEMSAFLEPYIQGGSVIIYDDIR
jgi:succinate dehydrogenase/fumarate reductase-like Fe-S protein